MLTVTHPDCRDGNDVSRQQGGYNTHEALTKTQQHETSVIEDSSRNILPENTAILTGGLSTAVAYQAMNSVHTLAYSRVTRPPHKRLKAYLSWGRGLKRLCTV